MQALAILRDQRAELFGEMPYDWAFDEPVYRRPMDASLQTQALQLLAAFRQHIADYPVERNGLGQVVCTMAIFPSTFGPGPRVLAAGEESDGGIVVSSVSAKRGLSQNRANHFSILGGLGSKPIVEVTRKRRHESNASVTQYFA